ncbi:MAG: efflux RND transporter periplasmic adaptor subunit [Pseudoflavonifractor sp.]|nr:efflux RND transporter periplasmic adaptor subunit [Alloprevotella sp.]MCM1116786.1 efflux RND transporter periplasmic adaptor subunit [Pseudoflavonifractor sp.]
MKKIFRILLWTIVAAIFIGSFVFLYLNSKEKPVRYENVTPIMSTLERTTVLTGTIEPRDEINIKPQISGIISEILVDPGDRVKEGDVIARIKVIPEASQLSSAQNRVDLARITLADAQQKYDRARQLYDKRVIAREEYETAETAIKQAQKELESAHDAFNIVKEGVSKYNATEANTMVRATISGIILDIPVKVGSSVIQANTMNDGTTIATIADMTDIIFLGKVDETEVGLLRPGMTMDVTIGALDSFTPTAVLEYIAPKGSTTTGANTFEIKAAISAPDSISLRAGYSANARVRLAGADNVVVIPESSVEWAGDTTFVYVMTDSLPEPKYARRQITTGLSDGLSIEVKSGLDTTMTIRGNMIND